jgi:hypothetical protein
LIVFVIFFQLYRTSRGFEGDQVTMMKNGTSFPMESLVNRSQAMVQKDEHDKACDQAAILIQTHFRKHSEGRALATTPSTLDDVLSVDPFATLLKPSVAPASSVMGDSTAASINDYQSSISEDCSSSDEYEDQFEVDYNEASKSEMTALTEPYYKGGKGMEEEKEEDKYPPPEQAPEKRSGKFLWGVAAGAVGLIGATMVVGMMSGEPIDEDDVVAVAGLVNSGGGGGSGAGGGAGGGGAGGGGGATGATTSAQ